MISAIKARPMSEATIISRFAKDLRKEFARQGNATIKWLNETGILEQLYEYFSAVYPELYEKSIEKVTPRDIEKINAMIYDWEEVVDPKKMEVAMEKWAIAAGTLGGRLALKDLKIQAEFNLRNPAILRELRNRGELITGAVAKRTLKDFRNLLVKTYAREGMSPYLVRKEIQGMFKETYKNRAMTIARTETATAQAVTRHETYSRNGVRMKRWVAFIDDRVRDSHREANRQVRQVDEMFDVGTSKMMYDHDPNGGAEEVVNCRCSTQYFTDTSRPYQARFTGE